MVTRGSAPTPAVRNTCARLTSQVLRYRPPRSSEGGARLLVALGQRDSPRESGAVRRVPLGRWSSLLAERAEGAEKTGLSGKVVEPLDSVAFPSQESGAVGQVDSLNGQTGGTSLVEVRPGDHSFDEDGMLRSAGCQPGAASRSRSCDDIRSCYPRLRPRHRAG